MWPTRPFGKGVLNNGLQLDRDTTRKNNGWNSILVRTRLYDTYWYNNDQAGDYQAYQSQPQQQQPLALTAEATTYQTPGIHLVTAVSHSQQTQRHTATTHTLHCSNRRSKHHDR